MVPCIVLDSRLLKKKKNLACSYPLFEPFCPGGNLTSTASSKTSFKSSTVAEKGRFFTNSVRASLSVGQMSVSEQTLDQTSFQYSEKVFLTL